ISSGSLPAGLTLSATTGASVTIGGSPSAAGSYTYTIKVADSSSPAQSASQAFSGNIPAATALTVSPGTLSFTYQPGGTVPSQRVSVSSSSSAVSYTVSVASGCAWLSTSAAGGTTNGAFDVSANAAGLNPSTNNCTITVSGGGATQSVFVTFVVGGGTL